MKEANSGSVSGSTSKSVRRQREKEKKIKKDKRTQKILYGTLIAAAIFSFFWIIALSTDHWAYLVLPKTGVKMRSLQPSLVSEDDGQRPTAVVIKMYIGLWRHCRLELTNASTGGQQATTSFKRQERSDHNISGVDASHASDDHQTKANVEMNSNEFCTKHSFYPSADEHKEFGLDQGLLDYWRATTGMAIIGVVISIIANAFCYYSIVRPRYVIRRLAGCMQLGAAGCLVVCIEIFEGCLSYAHSNLPQVYPPQTLYQQFGFSYGLAWVCFAIFLLAGLVFLFNSRKDKSTDKDQPVNIGRI